MARRDSVSLDHDVTVDVSHSHPFSPDHHRAPSSSAVPGNIRPLRSTAPIQPPHPLSSLSSPNVSAKYHHAGPGSSTSNNASSARDGRANPPPGYTLMFVGRSVGKTSLLRLLLDTLDVSPRTTMAQAEDVARFVLNASARTAQFCATSIEALWEPEPGDGRHVVLNLIDTPSLDPSNMSLFDRTLTDIMHLVESRFMESIDLVS